MTGATRRQAYLEQSQAANVAELILDLGPDAKMTRDVVQDFTEALSVAEADDDLKAIVIRGVGPDLCTGFDVAEATNLYAEHSSSKTGKYPSLRRRLMTHDQLFWGGEGMYWRLARSPKVTVLAAKGRCFGVGLYLTLCCDLVAAGPGSRFGNPRWRQLGADGDMMMLINAVGLKRARSAVFCGTEWSGEAAKAVGLVDTVVADDEVEEAALAVASLVSGVVRDGLAAEKYLVKAALERAHVGTGFAIASFMGAMASNVHFREGEFNFLKHARDHGFDAAVMLANEFYGTVSDEGTGV